MTDLDATSRLAEAAEKLTEALAASEERMAQAAADAAERVAVRISEVEPSTPSLRTDAEPMTKVRDRFDQMGYTREDFELAGMIFGGTRELASVPTVAPPEDFQRAWRYHLFEAAPPPMLSDGNGKAVRAMDSAESGFGADLIGAQYVSSLWAAARNNDGLLGRVREISMTDPTTYIPIDGDLPEMLFVGESTTYNATAYTSVKTASSRVTLTAKKFTIQQIWSGELNEDSIITYTPFLRERMAISAALYAGSAMYNGDTTNAGTGNINSDDADPSDTKHYLAFDGVRHYWLVDATGQGKDMAGTLDPREIDRARGKLNGGDDDVDALIKNINWGLNARDLLLVSDWDTYMGMLNLDEVRTVDRYGGQATVVTGELGSFSGIPIISPAYASKTEADGKASGTETNNTKGAITVMNPSGFIAGVRRDTQLFFDRIQRTDQFLFELYTRRAFTRFGGNVAAGIYDITP